MNTLHTQHLTKIMQRIGVISFMTLSLFLIMQSPALAATCDDGKSWRYIDHDKDRLGNPSKKKRLCRETRKEGYVKNRKDTNDKIAQFRATNLSRGRMKITLRDKTQYTFRLFNTKKTKKKLTHVRFYKNGDKRNSLIVVHPHGKSIQFVRYFNGFAERKKEISTKKWDKKFVTLSDFNLDGGPEVIVVLKNEDTVQTHMIRYVFRKGFTTTAMLELNGLSSVKVKNTTIEGMEITLRDTNNTPLKQITATVDTENFTLTERE